LKELTMSIGQELPFRLADVFGLSMQLTKITASLLPEYVFEDLTTEEVSLEVQELFKDNLQMMMDLTKPMDEDEAEGLGVMLPNEQLKNS
jgi:hypothetical protein